MALKLAKIEEGGMLEQWYAMSRARSLEEFRTALARLGLPYLNTIYADAAGNILYVYGGAIPRRSTAFDWSKPVDGSNPATEWQGYHRLDELPQVLNPASGYRAELQLQSVHHDERGESHAGAVPCVHVRPRGRRPARVDGATYPLPAGTVHVRRVAASGRRFRGSHGRSGGPADRRRMAAARQRFQYVVATAARTGARGLGSKKPGRFDCRDAVLPLGPRVLR